MQKALIPAADSLGAAQVASAPIAGTALATLGPFSAAQAGVYYITYRWLLSGTTETATANLQLTANSANLTALPTISGSGWGEASIYLTIPASQFCYLKVVANATAGSVYSAQLMATKLSG